MDDLTKSQILGSILNTIEDLEYKINRLPEDEIFIHQQFKSLKNTIEHTYNQIEFGKDYLFKRNSLNKVNKLAKEKTFGQELKESLDEPDVIYFYRLKRTFKND